MKLKVNAAELIAARDIVDIKEKTRSIIKVECKEDGYIITATNGFALVELKSEHVSEDYDCGECFFKLSSIKKFLKAADRFVDICFHSPDKICLTAVDKSGKVRDSITIDCVSKSLFPTDDSVEKVLSSGLNATSETVFVNASYLCKIINGIEKAYGKGIAMSIYTNGEHSPIMINVSHTESCKLDAVRKDFRSALMPLNMRR